ncbi:MAG: DnaA N-terminal domain-containing protein, partial [Dehalococcoidia bacterium]
MHDEPAALWQSALKALSGQVSRANYDTWLDGTVGVSLEQDVLTVGTRSEFVTEWLQKRLRPAILRTLNEICETDLEVRFE